VLNRNGDLKTGFSKDFAKERSFEGYIYRLFLAVKDGIDTAIIWIRCLDPFEKELLIINSQKYKEQ
jgi:hypothetical protein